MARCASECGGERWISRSESVYSARAGTPRSPWCRGCALGLAQTERGRHCWEKWQMENKLNREVSKLTS